MISDDFYFYLSTSADLLLREQLHIETVFPPVVQ